MSLLRYAFRSASTPRALNPNYTFSSLLRDAPRRFSTGAEQTPAPSSNPSADNYSVDPFLQDSSTSCVYGKLSGFFKHTMTTDILNMFEGINLSYEDVKFAYNRSFLPFGILVRFPNRIAFSNARGILIRKGRLYKLDMTDRPEWDNLMPYYGKTVLLQGIPRGSNVDDIDRFLYDCDFDGSSVKIQPRLDQSGMGKYALVQFPTRAAAMNVVITRNGSFIENNRVLLRVLE